VDGEVRLAELLAGLAVATDLGMGQPAGHAARTCLFAVRVAVALGVEGVALSDVYYTALLRYLGCTADAYEVSRLAGDERALAVAVGPHVMGDAAEHAAAANVADPGRAMASAMAVHCEAAELLAARLGLGQGVLRALRHGFERWDGGGHPAGLAGEAIPLAVRIAVPARDVELWRREGGPDVVRAVLRSRRGRAYDPQVVDACLQCEPVTGEDPWPELFAAEPAPRTVSAAELDGPLTVFADFTDVKLPYAAGHSRMVARLAADAGAVLGLDVTRLRHAGLVHDLGRAGVSNAVWDRPGRLTADEWERVRIHPYLTERILSRCPPLAGLARLAGAHHERLDGSGYHRGSTAATLGPPERVLAAADAYAAMRQDRPHRPALTAELVARGLTEQVEAGALDGRAVSAVIDAAAEITVRVPMRWPAGLTDREVEVLRLACRGLSIQQIAHRLVISTKTVDRHLQHSYAKIGVSSRAAATLFVVTHGLLADMG